MKENERNHRGHRDILCVLKKKRLGECKHRWEKCWMVNAGSWMVKNKREEVNRFIGWGEL